MDDKKSSSVGGFRFMSDIANYYIFICSAQFMPKDKNIVLIKGDYYEKFDQICDKFEDHDVLELRATDEFIEMAIKLSE